MVENTAERLGASSRLQEGLEYHPYVLSIRETTPRTAFYIGTPGLLDVLPHSGLRPPNFQGVEGHNLPWHVPVGIQFFPLSDGKKFAISLVSSPKSHETGVISYAVVTNGKFYDHQAFRSILIEPDRPLPEGFLTPDAFKMQTDELWDISARKTLTIAIFQYLPQIGPAANAHIMTITTTRSPNLEADQTLSRVSYKPKRLHSNRIHFYVVPPVALLNSTLVSSARSMVARQRYAQKYEWYGPMAEVLDVIDAKLSSDEKLSAAGREQVLPAADCEAITEYHFMPQQRIRIGGEIVVYPEGTGAQIYTTGNNIKIDNLPTIQITDADDREISGPGVTFRLEKHSSGLTLTTHVPQLNPERTQVDISRVDTAPIKIIAQRVIGRGIIRKEAIFDMKMPIDVSVWDRIYMVSGWDGSTGQRQIELDISHRRNGETIIRLAQGRDEGKGIGTVSYDQIPTYAQQRADYVQRKSEQREEREKNKIRFQEAQALAARRADLHKISNTRKF